jgi:hypothetical protein
MFAQATQDIAALRDQAVRHEIILGYVDESGFCATPNNRYAWTTQGAVHCVDAVRQKRVNVMGCLLSTGQLVTSRLHESVNSEWFYSFLTGVAKQVKEVHGVPLVFIVDNASIHRSKKMENWRKLLAEEYSTTLYFLPAYSPELNRIEIVWKQMKYRWRDFKVMTGEQIDSWVSNVSAGFGSKYMFNF